MVWLGLPPASNKECLVGAFPRQLFFSNWVRKCIFHSRSSWDALLWTATLQECPRSTTRGSFYWGFIGNGDSAHITACLTEVWSLQHDVIVSTWCFLQSFPCKKKQAFLENHSKQMFLTHAPILLQPGVWEAIRQSSQGAKWSPDFMCNLYIHSTVKLFMGYVLTWLTG